MTEMLEEDPFQIKAQGLQSVAFLGFAPPLCFLFVDPRRCPLKIQAVSHLAIILYMLCLQKVPEDRNQGK